MSIVDSTQLTCTTPVGDTGAVDVTVENPDGQSDLLVDGFTFEDPPNASFTVSPNPCTVGASVIFDGSGSTDDGTITLFEWDFDGDGSFDATGDAATFQITDWEYDAPGTYTARLRVTDDDTITGEFEQSVQVTSNPADLSACFTVTPDPPDLEMPIEFWDPGCSTGTGLEYRWVFSVPDLGPSMDMCFGAGATSDGSTDSPCNEVTFSSELEAMSYGMEGPSGLWRRTTLSIKDSQGNIESISIDYFL